MLHDMYNELISTLSSVVTEAIVDDVGDSYALEVFWNLPGVKIY